MTPFDQGPYLPAPLLALDLSDEHAAVLRASAIDFVRVQERQYRTVPAGTSVIGPVGAELIRLGFNPFHVSHACATGAYVAPHFDAYGDVVSAQLRFDSPIVGADGKATKCIGPAAPVPVRLDFGPTPTDAADPLWITEGVKKADALHCLGLRAVSMPGVWNWKDKKTGIHPDLDALPKGMTVRIVFDADAAEKSGVAKAQEVLVNWLRTAKDATVSVAVLPGVVGGHECKGVDDHLAAGFTLSELEACLTSDVPKSVDVKAQEKAVKVIEAIADGTNPEDVVTDARMAVLVATELFPGRFRWAKGAGWMHWDGCRWAIDGSDDGAVHDAVRVFLKDWYNDRADEIRASGAMQSRDGLATLRLYRTVCDRPKRQRIVEDAKNVDGVRCDSADFDTDPFVINTPDGILDLRTGVVTPPDPNVLVTKVTGARYVPGARHVDWDKALEAIPDDTRWWIQLRLGDALTGFPAADAGVMFWYGGGDNGKSVLLDAVKRAMGSEYAGEIPQQVIIGDFTSHSTGWTTLRGLRLATVEELPGGRLLNLPAVKRLAGTAEITARKMRQDDVTFKQTHSLIVTSNYQQIVPDTDRGTWKRLIRVPFPYEFAGKVESPNQRQGDENIVERMYVDVHSIEAVFAWLVEGAMRFLNEYKYPKDGSPGRKLRNVMPDRVRRECEEWRRTSDPTYTFVTDVLVWDANGIVTSADLLAAYNGFLSTQGMSKVSARTLKDRLEAAAKSAAVKVGSFSGPVLKRVGRDDVSRAPVHLVSEPSAIGSTPPAGNPFAGTPEAPAARTAVRVYTGLRFRTDQDDAAAEAAELVEAAELITATAAATGAAASGTADDRDQDDEAGVGMAHSPTCAEDGCTAFGYQGHDRCSDHVPWCTYEGTKCFDVSAAYPAPGPCGYHDQGDEVECAIEDCDDDVYVPSISPLCREHLREAAEDAYGDDFDAYLSDSTAVRATTSHAIELGGDVDAAHAALARWWVDAAARRVA